MKSLRTFVAATVLALGAFTFVAPVFAEEPKKEEMKCDKAGKACKDGADCKAENCKPKK